MTDNPLHLGADCPIFAVKFTEPIKVDPEEIDCKVYIKDDTSIKKSKGLIDSQNFIVIEDGTKVCRVGASSRLNGASSYALVSYDSESHEWSFHSLSYARVGTQVKSLDPMEKLTNQLFQKANHTNANVFRSGRFIRKIEKQDLARIKGDSMIDPAIAVERLTENISKSTAIKAKVREKSDAVICPPRNTKARTISEIYNADDITPREILASIDTDELNFDTQVLTNNETLSNLEKFCPWIYRKIVSCITYKEDKQTLRKLLYLSYMIKLYSFYNSVHKMQNLYKSLNKPPQNVYMYLLSSFTEEEDASEFGGYKPSITLKNKLLSYIICLTIIVSNYELDPQDLVTDLREPVSRIVKVAKALGCKFQVPSGEKKRKRVKVLALCLTK